MALSITHWNLLIGIDQYPSPERRLRGCVNNVHAVKRYLDATVTTGLETTMLTASRSISGGDAPAENENELPIFERVVHELSRITNEVKAGDRVLFYFSGHCSGFRGSTAGLNFLEQSSSGFATRCMREETLFKRLETIVARGVFVTVILDSDIPETLFNRLSLRNLPFSPDYSAMQETKESSLSTAPGIMLLGACAPGESVGEAQIAGACHSRFTCYLLQTLHTLASNGMELTHHTIHNHLSTVFHAHWPLQNPTLYGKTKFALFEKPYITPPSGVIPVAHSKSGDLILGAGKVHGVRLGDYYYAYSPKTDKTPQSMLEDEAIANVQVKVVKLFESILEVVGSGLEEQCMRTHTRARSLTGFSPEMLRIGVPPNLIELWRSEDRIALRKMCILDPEPYDELCDYRVVVNKKNQYEFFHGASGSSRVLLIRTIPCGLESSPRLVMSLLQRIAAYRRLEGLRNRLSRREFQSSLVIDYENPLGIPNTNEVADRGKLIFHVQNTGLENVYITIINLTTSWDIVKMTNCSKLVKAKTESRIVVMMEIPKHLQDYGHKSCTDVIMFIMSNQASPQLDGVGISRTLDHETAEEFLAQFSSSLSHQNDWKWCTRSFVFHIREAQYLASQQPEGSEILFALSEHDTITEKPVSTAPFDQTEQMPMKEKGECALNEHTDHATPPSNQARHLRLTSERAVVRNKALISDLSRSAVAFKPEIATESSVSRGTVPSRDASRTLSESTEQGLGRFAESTEPTEVTGEDFLVSEVLDGQILSTHYAVPETVYEASDTSSSPRLQEKGYINDLAEALLAVLKASITERKTLDHILEILPSLLRAFALKVGYEGQSQMHRDVAYFVRKYRRSVPFNLAMLTVSSLMW